MLTQLNSEQEKQEEKAKKLQEKMEVKHRKDEEKAAKAEEKRQAKEEKRRSKLGPAGAAAVITSPSAPQHDDDGGAVSNRDGDVQAVAAEAPSTGRHKGGDASSPTVKVKGWLKNTFSREKSSGEQNKKRRSFFGGASMKNKGTSGNGSAVSIENRSTSMQDDALAGKAGNEVGEPAPHDDGDRDSQGVSPVSSLLEEERDVGAKAAENDILETEAGEARVGRKKSVEAPRLKDDAVARTSSSPNRDSRFREELK